jgi:hypothetical protein
MMKLPRVIEEKRLTAGQLVKSRDGRLYRVANVSHTDKDRGTVETLQLERATRKVKGKAARRADKLARRLAREATGRSI